MAFWMVLVSMTLAAPAAPAPTRQPPEGWVELQQAIPGVRYDIRYHVAENFTGAQLPGYAAPGAWLLEPVAVALRKVHESLAEKKLGLIIFDAYRPRRASQAMVAWAERTHQTFLLDNGYIARVSQHNRGTTVDLGLVVLETGELVDMGTPFDELTERSHTRNAVGVVLENRLTLKTAMQAQGFEAYWKEWWHFSHPMDPKPILRDVPYGCGEPDEGSWKAPTGWATPGWTSPESWVEAPGCK